MAVALRSSRPGFWYLEAELALSSPTSCGPAASSVALPSISAADPDVSRSQNPSGPTLAFHSFVSLLSVNTCHKA